MDVVSLFAIAVFGTSWFLLARTSEQEVVVRILLKMMLVLGALVGVFGIVLRFTQVG